MNLTLFEKLIGIGKIHLLNASLFVPFFIFSIFIFHKKEKEILLFYAALTLPTLFNIFNDSQIPMARYFAISIPLAILLSIKTIKSKEVLFVIFSFFTLSLFAFLPYYDYLFPKTKPQLLEVAKYLKEHTQDKILVDNHEHYSYQLKVYAQLPKSLTVNLDGSFYSPINRTENYVKILSGETFDKVVVFENGHIEQFIKNDKRYQFDRNLGNIKVFSKTNYPVQ